MPIFLCRYLRGILPLLILPMLQFTAAQVAFSQQLIIEKPWARASIGTKRPGSVFMTIRNTGTADDVLVAIDTPQANRAEVHRTSNDNGVASMSPAGPVKLPGGGKIMLAPGGLHIMLMKLNRPLVEGSTLPLTLIFKQAGRTGIEVPVLGAGALGPAD